MSNYYNSRRSYRKTTGRGSYRRVTGRGAYNVDDAPWANRGAAIGRTLGGGYGAIGSGIGGWLGRRIFGYGNRLLGGSGAYRRKTTGRGAYRSTGRKMKSIRGRGAYTTDGSFAPEIPLFEKGSSDDSVVITHREYIGDVITSGTAGAFKVTEYSINAGDASTFPWASTVAQVSYSQYKLEGCIFEFQSASGDSLNSVNTALGTVIGVVNYDVNDASFTSRMQMENTSWANSCKPSKNMSIGVECARNRTQNNGLFFIRQTGALPSGADRAAYDLGKLSLATTGFQGTSVNIGSLFVSYKMRLLKPYMTEPLANGNVVSLARSGCTTAAPFGTITYTPTWQPPCDSLGVTFSTNTITIAKRHLAVGQRYSIVMRWGVVSGATTCPNVLPPSGRAMWNAAFGTNNDSDGYIVPYVAGSTVTEALRIVDMSVLIADEDLVITAADGVLPVGGTPIFNLYMKQVNGLDTPRIGSV
nr:MAG: putative capsid protein [Arizlama virus]